MAKNTSGTAFSFTTAEQGAPAGDVLLVPVQAKPQPPMELVSRVDKFCGGAVARLMEVKALRGKVGQLAHSGTTGKCPRVLLISLGAADELRAHQVRQAGAAAARWLMGEQIERAAMWIDGLVATRVADATAEFALGMALAGYRFLNHKTPEERPPAKVRVELRASQGAYLRRAQAGVRDVLKMADAVNYTRRLGHEPANVINPATLATEARRLARESKLKCTVLNTPRLKQLGMGGLLAVGQGAQQPACLIQLEYRGTPRARATTVLVGKAITFDTGGYSIKPSSGLEEMKFDKCGGMTVLGILKAVASLKLKCNVVGLIAAAENAVSEKAYKPGDIIDMMSGKTVEVISTDAEGRLVLADALWYAQRKLRPTTLIDLATLTGGVGVALGSQAAGLMSNDDALASDLGEAGRVTHERLWRLPLWDDYRESIKSTEADIKNSAGKRAAHAIVGGDVPEGIRGGGYALGAS